MRTAPMPGMAVEIHEAEMLAIQQRMAAKGLELEPGNEGEALDYLNVVFARTCERLDRENADA